MLDVEDIGRACQQGSREYSSVYIVSEVLAPFAFLAARYAFIRFDTSAFCAARESAYRFTGVTGFAGESDCPF
jgi:hypothetical protein